MKIVFYNNETDRIELTFNGDMELFHEMVEQCNMFDYQEFIERYDYEDICDVKQIHNALKDFEFYLVD
jgi:hypothetical protein